MGAMLGNPLEFDQAWLTNTRLARLTCTERKSRK